VSGIEVRIITYIRVEMIIVYFHRWLVEARCLRWASMFLNQTGSSRAPNPSLDAYLALSSDLIGWIRKEGGLLLASRPSTKL